VAAISEAKSLSCDIIVLPECLDVGWTYPQARQEARPVPGEYSAVLAAEATRQNMYVVAGLTERAETGAVYNTAVLISPQGSVVSRHRKINELSIAHHLYDTGDRLSVAQTSKGVIGLSVCADNYPTSLVFGHSLGRMGAQMLLSPCAWAVDGDHDNVANPYGGMWLEAYTTLARLYGMAVVGVSCVGWMNEGPWKGRKCIGNSLAVGPEGEVLARGPYGETAEAVLVAEVPVGEALARGTDFAPLLRSRGYEGP